jgi:hypothetical protein
MVFAFAIRSKQHRPYRNKCFALVLLALLVPRSSDMAKALRFGFGLCAELSDA